VDQILWQKIKLIISSFILWPFQHDNASFTSYRNGKKNYNTPIRDNIINHNKMIITSLFLVSAWCVLISMIISAFRKIYKQIKHYNKNIKYKLILDKKK